MAAYAAPCRRALKLGTGSANRLFSSDRLDSGPISQLPQPNGQRLFLVDTLALVKKLESKGLHLKQAEAITEAMTEVLNDSMKNVCHSYVSKSEMQKNEMTQQSNLSNFKTEVKGSQDHHFSVLQHEAEKIKNDIEKMRSELRYEIDKVTAGQRLDLNLERGRIRDDLNNQSQGTTNLTTKLDREIQALRAQLEAAKYDVIKYCIAGLVERVVLLGAPIGIKDMNWEATRKVVAGRYVNAYSTNDWMLGIAFRANLLTQGLAGIQPVDVPGIENVDVTEVIEGHSSYLWRTHHILEQLELDTYYPVFNRRVVKS